MDYLPLALKIKNKCVVVAGGGKVAERKIKFFLRAGAKVRVVSPLATAKIKELARGKKVKWISRKVRGPDLSGAHFIIAATDDFSVNGRIVQWARKRNVPVNVVDNSNLSDFISPAVFSAGKAQVAVYTDGRVPELSRDLKNYLKENWDEFLSYRNRP